MRILMVTDAWRPQVNGVIHTLERLAETLPRMGVTLEFLAPDKFRTIALPTYPDIRLALVTQSRIEEAVRRTQPDHIHIVTEGPLGIQARRYCLRVKRPFTTSYHTRFPEYFSARLPMPESWTYAWLRGFHNAGNGTLVATKSLADDLARRGFSKLRPWTRGVDTEKFRPERRRDLGYKGPVFLCAGRVAVEKNLPAFLDLDLPGTKVIVGDGPDLSRLKAAYPAVHFLGYQPPDALADLYASADVFVFPSRTETFGNVVVEALASGTPVAAFPVTGPGDILADGLGGVISEDLGSAALAALQVSRQDARTKALRYSWDACAEMFLDAVRQARAKVPQAA